MSEYRPRPSRHAVRMRRRRRIFERDGAYCQNCWSRHDLTLDHVIPRARGGSSLDSNLQILCSACNGAKADRLSVPVRFNVPPMEGSNA